MNLKRSLLLLALLPFTPVASAAVDLDVEVRRAIVEHAAAHDAELRATAKLLQAGLAT